MGWDEKLFGFVQRTLGHLTADREDPAVAAAAVELDSVQRRLELVARLLGGPGIDVREAEAGGGVGSDVLRLPRRVAVAPDPVRNLRVLLHRVVFGIVARDTGYLLSAAGDRAERDLATLLAVGPVTASMAELHPGIESVAHCARCVSREQLLHDVRSREALPCVELLLLGAKPERLESVFRADVLRWAQDAAVRRLAPDELRPVARELLAGLPRGVRAGSARLLPYGRLDGHSGAEAEMGAVAVPDESPPSADELPSGTERKGRTRERVERRDTNEDARGENPLIHVFEKLLTAEEYQGGRRRSDGEDEMEEHGDALDELEMREVIRTSTPTRSVYRADVDGLGTVPEVVDEAPAAELLHYDEWDDKRREYRRDWCALRTDVAGGPDDPAAVNRWVRRVRQRYARQIRELRADLSRLDREREPRNRQRNGTEVDIDAVVDHLVTLRAARAGRGNTEGTDRLYVARRPWRHELATSVVLDASLSTDAWVGNRRVLDVAREAVLVLGEVFGDDEFPASVAAFHSHSRRDCRFARIKDFAEPWSVAHGRLHALKPAGYTRIGPALRHATHCLDDAPGRRRLLVLISDGKPTDYDRYEGRHGTADVRQALREARRRGITTYTLAIDTTARGHLVQMFGRDGFGVLSSAARLPAALVGLQQGLHWR